MRLFLTQLADKVVVQATAIGDGVIGDLTAEVSEGESWKGLTYEYLATLGNGEFEWDGTSNLTAIEGKDSPHAI